MAKLGGVWTFSNISGVIEMADTVCVRAGLPVMFSMASSEVDECRWWWLVGSDMAVEFASRYRKQR